MTFYTYKYFVLDNNKKLNYTCCVNLFLGPGTGSAGQVVGLVEGLVEGLVLFLRGFIRNWFNSHDKGKKLTLKSVGLAW